jgi:hypothetical protein
LTSEIKWDEQSDALTLILDTCCALVPKRPLGKNRKSLFAGWMWAHADVASALSEAAENGGEVAMSSIFTSRHGAFSGAVLAGVLCEFDEDLLSHIYIRWQN